MRYCATTLTIQCPACKEGEWHIDVDEDGHEIGSAPEIACENTRECEAVYLNGRYGDALAAAWQSYCDRDHSDAWNRRYRGADGSDSRHQMLEAQGLKR